MRAGFVVHIVPRWRWILALAALSTTTVYWLLREPVREAAVSQLQAPSPDSSARASATTPVVGAAAALPDRRTVDLFAPRTWEPPPSPIVSTPTPPPLQAPPLPFKFFGRVVDPDQPASFVLTRGNEMIAVRVGDRIEPAYLVDKFDGTQLHLLYLPLDIRQTIFVGNVNE